MYLSVGVMIGSALVYAWTIKKGKRESWGMYALVMLISSVLSLLSIYAESDSVLADSEKIKRPQPSQEPIQQEYELSVDSLAIQEPYQVVVENRHLTKQELEALFTEAVRELEKVFLGENTSVDCITHPVNLAETLLEGRVSVRWSMDHYGAINLNGELQEDGISETGTLVAFTAVLDYEGVQQEYRFSAQVFPPEKSVKEQFYERLQEMLQSENAKMDEMFYLPQKINGYVLTWEKKKQQQPYLILFLGVIAMAGIAIGKKEDARKKQQLREAQLAAEYPQFLSQMSLLLGAGMTVSRAWERMVLTYENKGARLSSSKKKTEQPIYEEMRITYYQMKDGIGERRAYELFGERLRLQMYRRFATLLVQNLRKGTAGLHQILEKEMQIAMDEQESLAKKKGEELQTRLLLPMMLMLALVIVIIMIPAIQSFQI